MQKLSDILPKVINQRSLDASATASQVLAVAEEYLTVIFGAENVGLGKNITGKKLQQGLVFFDVTSAAWNNRLFLEREGLLEMLREKFPELNLRDVRGRVGGE